MENLEQAPIGQLVAKNYRTAEVFRKYGIDFCCNGSRTIREACEQKKIDSKQLKTDIQQVLLMARQPADGSANFASWPLDLLADYIEKKHHRYVRDQIPLLEAYLTKLVKVHGGSHPELIKIRSLFGECAAELTVHMKKEELILFPVVKKMVMLQKAGGKPGTAHAGSVNRPIQQMMRDHAIEGERFKMINELTENYKTPADGCTTYGLTYDLLRAFERDLHLHIHLENNILFPKAVQLEQELMK